jgi:CspA family cold shock protein
MKISIREGVAMAFGIVKWFNNHKGFGFIESSEIGQDVFAYFSQVDMEGFKTLQQGASVMYEPIQGPRGWMAKNIKVIAAPASPGNAAEPQVSTCTSRLRAPQFRANLVGQNC